MERTLKDLRPGRKGRVVRLDGEGALRRRLMDMGLTPGVEVFVRKVAPLGDPIELSLRGYELSIRGDEARKIIIEEDRRRRWGHAG